MIPDDALHIMVGHVGERHIISLQKGKPGIVVLEIQRGPHARRHLVDKTENALVGAGTVIVHQAVFKDDSEILLIFLIDLQKPLLSRRLFHQHLHEIVLGQILIIEDVLHCLPVYFQKPVPGFDLHLLRDAARLDPGDPMSLFFHPSSPVLFLPKTVTVSWQCRQTVIENLRHPSILLEFS